MFLIQGEPLGIPQSNIGLPTYSSSFARSIENIKYSKVTAFVMRTKEPKKVLKVGIFTKICVQSDLTEILVVDSYELMHLEQPSQS